ncbi:MAG: hypothetical protein ACRYGO_07560 [Janthinobacterium lividum]
MPADHARAARMVAGTAIGRRYEKKRNQHRASRATRALVITTLKKTRIHVLKRRKSTGIALTVPVQDSSEFPRGSHIAVDRRRFDRHAVRFRIISDRKFLIRSQFPIHTQNKEIAQLMACWDVELGRQFPFGNDCAGLILINPIKRRKLIIS